MTTAETQPAETVQFKKKSKLTGRKRPAEEDIVSLLESTVREDDNQRSELGTRA